LPAVRQAELPGDVADQLPSVLTPRESAALVRQGQGLQLEAVRLLIPIRQVKEEPPLRVPELLLQVLLEARCPGAEAAGQRVVSTQRGDAGDGQGGGIEVTVERGPIAGGAADDVLCLPAVDVQLHAVVVTGLPEEANLPDELPLLPALVVFHQVG